MTIVVRGITETIAKLAAVGAASLIGVKEAVKADAEEVAQIARTEHPWNNVTGETEASIQPTETGVTAGGASFYLELGTSKMAARPFMRPAADSASLAAGEVAAAAIINRA